MVDANEGSLFSDTISLLHEKTTEDDRDIDIGERGGSKRYENVCLRNDFHVSFNWIDMLHTSSTLRELYDFQESL